MERSFFRDSHLHIVGVAVVTPGRCFDGNLETQWNAEERMCWKLAGYARDAYSVKVLRTAASHDLVRAQMENDNRCSYRRGGGRSFQRLNAKYAMELRQKDFFVDIGGGREGDALLGQDIEAEMATGMILIFKIFRIWERPNNNFV